MLLRVAALLPLLSSSRSGSLRILCRTLKTMDPSPSPPPPPVDRTAADPPGRSSSSPRGPDRGGTPPGRSSSSPRGPDRGGTPPGPRAAAPRGDGGARGQSVHPLPQRQRGLLQPGPGIQPRPDVRRDHGVRPRGAGPARGQGGGVWGEGARGGVPVGGADRCGAGGADRCGVGGADRCGRTKRRNRGDERRSAAGADGESRREM
ncbi:hypothetical protein NL108_018261 [Boleophthalmus pectinirostris]|nr:hypothetical protein NL108_018261 [Boleophthalmus pectinirostris]